MVITQDSLIDAIRTATSLQELKRLVGPSEEDVEESRLRLQAIDGMYEKADREGWGYDTINWPQPDRDRIEGLHTEQFFYNETYG